MIINDAEQEFQEWIKTIPAYHDMSEGVQVALKCFFIGGYLKGSRSLNQKEKSETNEQRLES